MAEISSVSVEMDRKTGCKRKPWLLNEVLKLGSVHPLDLVRGKRHFAIIFKSESIDYVTDGEHSIKAVFTRPPEVFPTAAYILSYAYYVTISVNDYQSSSFFIEIEIYQQQPCSSVCLDNADHHIKINIIPEIKQVLFHCLIGTLPYSPMIFYYDDAEENLSVLTNLVKEPRELSLPASPSELVENKPFTALRHHHRREDDVQISNTQNDEVSVLWYRATQDPCSRGQPYHHPQSTEQDGKANLQPFARKRCKSKLLQSSGGRGKKSHTKAFVRIENQAQGPSSPSLNDGDSQEAADGSTALSSDRVHKSFHNYPFKFSSEFYDSSESLFTDSDKSMREDKLEKAPLKDAPQTSYHSPSASHDKICPHVQENTGYISAKQADPQDFYQKRKMTIRTSTMDSVKFGSCSEHDKSETVQHNVSDDDSVCGSESLFSDSSQEIRENEGITVESD